MDLSNEDAKRHPRGGLYFEDFTVGTIVRHRLTRTVTQMDNMLFSNMTLNPQPLHIDAHFCATETEWGKPLMNSLFTLGLMIGMSVNDTTVGTTIANLGMTDVKFPAPLFEGDTVNATTEIVAVRESKSRPDAGIVDFVHRAYKQDGTLVAECRRQAFMRKRPARLMRSLLFVPGDSARKLEKGLGSGADALIVDLEDSVAPAGKAEARGVVAGFVRAARDEATRPRLLVRVNALATGLADADLDGVMAAGPDGIVLPKTIGGADVQHLGAKLAVREAALAWSDGCDAHPRHRDGERARRLRPRHLRRFEPAPLRRHLGRRGSFGRSRRRGEPRRGRRLHGALSARAQPHAPWLPLPPRSTRSIPCSRTSAISTGSSANAARRAATASSPSWRSTRRRCR